MRKITCPNCGESFNISNNDYSAIVRQVRDDEFNKEVQAHETILLKEKEAAIIASRFEVENRMKDIISSKDIQISELRAKAEKIGAEMSANIARQSKDYERRLQELQYQFEEEIEYYRDFKAKQSTKMIGESLERHCEAEFNKCRALAFPKAYFEKDNDISAGSKGDFIFREDDDCGIEIVSIMFEMKNEIDTTRTKRKNEDFLKKLDKDRRDKNCEYAVLVSLLETDNEYYNTGIVDMSYRYPKMYVIRPQFFIQIISLIRNAALSSLQYKTELLKIKNQSIDFANFEEQMEEFKDKFSRNYRIASERFTKAIEEIDKTIDHLQKTKEALMSSENNLRLANNKAEELTIKQLTKNSPSLAKEHAKQTRALKAAKAQQTKH